MNSSFKRHFKKPWVLVLLGLLLLLTIGVFSAKPIISSKMEGVITEKLAEKGLDIEWTGSSWDPVRGLHLSGMKISKSDGGEDQIGKPIAEVGSFSLRPSLWQYFGSEEGSMNLKIKSSLLVLRDEKGEISMEDVLFTAEIGKEKVEVGGLSLNRKGLSLDLEGEVALSASKGDSGEFEPDLVVFRTVFDILDIEGDEGAFVVEGFVTVDASKSEVAWDAEVEGQGENMGWKGVNWTKVKAGGKVSSADTEIDCDLETANGSTNGKVTNSGEEGAPFVITGELSDSAGETNQYEAKIQDGVLTVETFKGSANLWTLSEDVKRLNMTRPEKVDFRTFPRIEITNLERKTVDGETKMTIESIALDSLKPVELEFEGREVKFTDCKANGKYDGKNWIIEDSEAGVLDGTVTLSGSFREKVLRDLRLGIKGLRIEEVRRVFDAGSGESNGNVSGDFNGFLNFETKAWEGSGFLQLTDAPVIEVPLLDQVYQIFMSAIPGVEREKKGEFEADFTKEGKTVNVSEFRAMGGKSLVVTAEGEVDLEDERVSGTASSELVGLPGALTSPVTKLVKMKVSGPFDNIQVEPMGPVELVKGAIEGAADGVKDAAEGAEGVVEKTVDTLKDAGQKTGEAIKDGVTAPLEWMGIKDDDSDE